MQSRQTVRISSVEFDARYCEQQLRRILRVVGASRDERRPELGVVGLARLAPVSLVWVRAAREQGPDAVGVVPRRQIERGVASTGPREAAPAAVCGLLR